MSKSSVGEKIKEIRISLGMTQEMFANKLSNLLNETKLSKGTVNNWEHDRNMPNKKRIKAISDISGVPINTILGENNLNTYSEVENQKSERLGQVIRQQQEKLNLTNAEFARRINIPVSTFYRHKKGNFYHAPVTEVFKIFEVLNISPRMLYVDDLPFFESFEDYQKRQTLTDKFDEEEPYLTVDQLEKIQAFIQTLKKCND